MGLGDLLDFPGMISNAVTSLLGSLVEQLLKPVRELLADTLLATPDMTTHPDVKRLWRSSLVTAAGLYVLFVLVGGVTVMGYETVQTRYALKDIAPRLVFGLSAAVASLTVMGKAISLANALSGAIAQTDLSDAGKGPVERAIPAALHSGTAGVTLYVVILELCFLALVLAVLIGYLLRVGAVALLAVAAPLVLACHAHPVTDPVAKMWWRALAAAQSPARPSGADRPGEPSQPRKHSRQSMASASRRAARPTDDHEASTAARAGSGRAPVAVPPLVPSDAPSQDIRASLALPQARVATAPADPGCSAPACRAGPRRGHCQRPQQPQWESDRQKETARIRVPCRFVSRTRRRGGDRTHPHGFSGGDDAVPAPAEAQPRPGRSVGQGCPAQVPPPAPAPCPRRRVPARTRS